LYYDPVVGERSHDRQLMEARTAYVAAVFRLLKAMDAFNGSAFPLDPGSGSNSDPMPWSRKHVAIAQALEAGWRDVLRTRKAWDGLRREWVPPHG
jgi:hypothetical protein